MTYSFEYESDEAAGDDDANADLENMYYNSKQNKEEEPEEAISGFLKVARTF